MDNKDLTGMTKTGTSKVAMVKSDKAAKTGTTKTTTTKATPVKTTAAPNTMETTISNPTLTKETPPPSHSPPTDIQPRLTGLNTSELTPINFNKRITALETQGPSNTFNNGITVTAGNNGLAVDSHTLTLNGQTMTCTATNGFTLTDCSKMTIPNSWLQFETDQSSRTFEIQRDALSGKLQLQLSYANDDGTTSKLDSSQTSFTVRNKIDIGSVSQKYGIKMDDRTQNTDDNKLKIFAGSDSSVITLTTDEIAIKANKIVLNGQLHMPITTVIDLDFSTGDTANLYHPYEHCYIMRILCRNVAASTTLSIATSAANGSASLLNAVTLPTAVESFQTLTNDQIPLQLDAPGLGSGDDDYVVFTVSNNNSGKLKLRVVLQEIMQ